MAENKIPIGGESQIYERDCRRLCACVVFDDVLRIVRRLEIGDIGWDIQQ